MGQLNAAIEKAHCEDPSKQLAVKEEEKEMSEQSQNNSFIAKWGSAFSESLSKSLDMNNGVWPMSTERRMSLQTPSFTSTTKTFGGNPGGGDNSTEKECRQVFFDCAL